MKLKILRVKITSEEGKKILKPKNKVIKDSDLKYYRKSLKENESDSVLFTFKEIK